MGREEQEYAREKVIMSVAKYALSAPIYLAQEKGYFAAEGVKVSLQETAAGKLSLQDVLSGKADMGTVAGTPIVYAVAAGTPLSIIATLGHTDADYSVLGRKDHGISSFADLKGKRIGLSIGTTGEYYFDRLLLMLEIPDHQVQVIDVSPANVVQALVEGKVDAIITWYPFLSEAQEKLGAKAIHLVKDELIKTDWMIVASPAYIHKHPAAVRAVLRALIRAEVDLLRKPEEARRVTAREMGMDSGLLARAWSTYHFGTALDQSLITTLEEESRWAIENRHVRTEKTPNFLRVIDYSALQDIGPERVQIIR